MPIKEILMISATIVASVCVANPGHFAAAMTKARIAILRDVGRTDNWGNPSIFPHKRQKLILIKGTEGTRPQ